MVEWGRREVCMALDVYHTIIQGTNSMVHPLEGLAEADKG
jgi:hypothetical protein